MTRQPPPCSTATSRRIARAALLALALATGGCGGDSSGSEPGGPDAAPAAVPPDAGAAAVKSGCADGEREGFVSTETHPDLAACAGGWAEPGLFAVEPACDRAAGDDGAAPDGAGCNVADLCAEGWHVCVGAAEVGARSGGTCEGAAPDPAAAVFYVTRQSGPGGAECAEGTNDLFGCGTLGAAVTQPSCTPLDRFSHDLCSALPAPWSCGDDGAGEALAVSKPAPEAGGVLCCRNGPLLTPPGTAP